MDYTKNEENLTTLNQMFPIHIRKRENETSRQFDLRKKIYDKVFNDLKDEEKALIYSNIWINIFSLGCNYPPEVLDLIEKYRPDDSENVYFMKQAK